MNSKNNCIILNYHSIYDVGAHSTHIDPVYTIDLDTFRTHLALFQKLDLNVVSLDELKDLKPSDKFCLCITFDDGHASDHELAAPLLDEYGFKASFFPTLMNFKENDPRWSSYCVLAESGHLVGAHGVSHQYLPGLNVEEQIHELKASKYFIEDRIGQSVDYFSLPGGKYNQKTIQLAKEVGYEKVLTTDFEFLDPQNLPFTIGRWSIKKNTSIAVLEAVLRKDPSTIRRIKFKKNLAKNIGQVIGNNLTDKLNNFINSK